MRTCLFNILCQNGRVHTQHLGGLPKFKGCLEKGTWAIADLCTDVAASFTGHHFHWRNDRQTLVIQTGVSGRQVSLSLQKNRTDSFGASDKTRAFKWKLEFGKTCICILYLVLDSFPILKHFSDEIGSELQECDILMLYNEMCQQWKDPHTSVNQYFPNNPCLVLQNHAWVKIHATCKIS